MIENQKLNVYKYYLGVLSYFKKQKVSFQDIRKLGGKSDKVPKAGDSFIYAEDGKTFTIKLVKKTAKGETLCFEYRDNGKLKKRDYHICKPRLTTKARVKPKRSA